LAVGRPRAPIGTERVNSNGYLQVKIAEDDWQYKHRVEAEKKLGRPLEDNERVTFKDGNKQNLDHDNLVIRYKNPVSYLYRKRAYLRRQIQEARFALKQLEDQLEALDKKLKPDRGQVAELRAWKGPTEKNPV
jgi:hypothetical protein